MLKRLVPVAIALLAACAANPPPPPAAEPEPAPPPAIITDEGTSASDADSVQAPPDTPARPQQTDAGRFRVGVASMDSAEATRAWVMKLEAAGYRTEILPVEIDGKTWHRVLLPGYANLEEARAAIPFVESEFGVSGVWVTSRRRAPMPSPEAAAPATSEPTPAS